MFFSAVLAGYFAWKTVSSSPELISDDSPVDMNDKEGLSFNKVSIYIYIYIYIYMFLLFLNFCFQFMGFL